MALMQSVLFYVACLLGAGLVSYVVAYFGMRGAIAGVLKSLNDLATKTQAARSVWRTKD